MDLVHLLGLVAGLFLLAAAASWLRVGSAIGLGVDRPAELPIHRVASAANVTALALGLSGVALVTLFLVRFG